MTVVHHWSTGDVAARDRLGAWSDKMQALHLDWDITAEPGCEADIRHRRSGDIVVSEFRGSGFAGSRAPERDTADVVGIQLALSGNEPLIHGQDEFVLGVDSLFVWSSGLSRSFESLGEHHEVTVMIPRAKISGSLDSWVSSSRPLSTAVGTGLLALAADQMRSIARELHTLSDRSLELSVDLLLDTLNAAVPPAHMSARSDRTAMFDQVQRFIDEHLADPGLSASSIARAHGISVRTLHTVFSESGTSVARDVRRRRLEKSRRELAYGSGGTVTDVAFRWGFVDAAHFSRTFKKEFGVTPSSVLSRR